MTPLLAAPAVFASMVACDLCWARYVRHASDGSRWLAGFWAVGLFAAGAFSVVSYVDNHWLLIPAALGSFTGTVAGVKAKA